MVTVTPLVIIYYQSSIINYIMSTALQQTTPAAAPAATLKGMLSNESVKRRFEELLGKKAAGFMSSILSVVGSNSLLQKANANTVISAAVIAATLDLPINPNLGFAYIVPYKGDAAFQMGYKGFIQLAMRSGQYKTINVCEVYEGEIKKENRFTGEYELGERTSDTVVGYMAYFKMLNGFEKYLYMTRGEAEAHGRKYSQTYKLGKGLWAEQFDLMAKKTVLKMLISKFGIMSIDMQTAQVMDQAVVKGDLTTATVEEAEVSYVDNTGNDGSERRDTMRAALDEATIVDTETGELFSNSRQA